MMVIYRAAEENHDEDLLKCKVLPGITPRVTDVIIPCSIGSLTGFGDASEGNEIIEFGKTKYAKALNVCQVTS